MGRNAFRGGSNQRLLGILGSLEKAFLNFAIALLNIVVHLLRQILEFFYVGLNCVRKVAELKRKQVGIGKTHHGGAAGLGKSAAVDKIGIAEMRVPIKIVVDGMVDSTAVFPIETNIE